MTSSSTWNLIRAAVDAVTSTGTALLNVGGANMVVKFSASNYIPGNEAIDAENVIVCLYAMTSSPQAVTYLSNHEGETFYVNISNSPLGPGSTSSATYGIININTNDTNNLYQATDGSWNQFTIQHIVNHEFVHAFADLDDGPEHNQIVNGINADTYAGPPRLSYEAVLPAPRCFLFGTPITMADGSQKPIEEIKIGDMVMAFDEFANKGKGKLEPRRVTRTMQGHTSEVIDLRGLRVTPGHRFLSDDGAWVAIERILKDDGIIVEQRAEGPVDVRARTGAAIGSVEDILVPISFIDIVTRRERTAQVRAGIPCLGRKGSNGSVELFNLYRMAAHYGWEIHADGRTVDQSGIFGDILGWPEGASPLDATYMQDWIVKLDGEPFTPQWIADISDADEGRQVINGTPILRTPGRSGSGHALHTTFSPAVIQGGRATSGGNRKARRKQAALSRVK